MASSEETSDADSRVHRCSADAGSHSIVMRYQPESWKAGSVLPDCSAYYF